VILADQTERLSTRLAVSTGQMELHRDVLAR
jgi:hypothetical protein